MKEKRVLNLFILFMAIFGGLFVSTSNVKAGDLIVVARANDGTAYRPKTNEYIAVVCYGKFDNSEIVREVNVAGGAVFNSLAEGRYVCWFTTDSDNVDKNARVDVDVTNEELTVDLLTGLDNDAGEDDEEETTLIPVSITRKNESGRNLAFASLQIINSKTNEVVKEWESSSYTIKINLEPGSYVIKEITAPSGYELAKDYNFEVSENAESIEIDIVSSLIVTVDEMTLQVKYFDENNKYLSGTTLRLLDANGIEKNRWTTGSSAQQISNLPLGFYTIEEVKAADGYTSVQKVNFELATAGEMYTVELTTSPLVKVPDTLSNFSKVIIAAGITGLLAGLGLLYFSGKRKEEV